VLDIKVQGNDSVSLSKFRGDAAEEGSAAPGKFGIAFGW
jgi:hypothetical protein